MPSTLQLSRRSFVLSAVCLAACKPGSAVLELTGTTMGTTYSIIAVDHDGAVNKAELHTAVDKSLMHVNALMSNWDASSEVSRFNASSSTSGQAVSTDLAYVVSTAEQVHATSDGFFDITLGPVIEAWGFGAGGAKAHAPDASLLTAAMEHAGQDKLTVTDHSLTKSAPGTQIYLPSIGKGFGVDRVAQTVAAFGLTDFMIEIGGDLYVSGKNANGLAWQIGIETPDALNRSVYEIAKVSNLGMATSGDYRNFFDEDGQRFSHIIDPHTGRPVTHRTASVTVLAKNAMLADAWSTALLAMGTERGLDVANEQGLAALFIDRNDASGDAGYAKTVSQEFAALQA